MEFLVCKKQAGEGCDYTIGCGMVYEIEEAESRAALIESIVWPEGKDEYCTLDGYEELEEILIVELNEDTIYSVDVPEMKKAIKLAEEREAEREVIAQEKAELARLKEKYGA